MDSLCSSPCQQQDLAAPPGCGSDGGSCPPSRHRAIYKVTIKIGEIPPQMALETYGQTPKANALVGKSSGSLHVGHVPPCIFPGDVAGSCSKRQERSARMGRGWTSVGMSSLAATTPAAPAKDAVSHGKAICPPNFGSSAQPPQPHAAQSKGRHQDRRTHLKNRLFAMIFGCLMKKQSVNWLFWGDSISLPRARRYLKLLILRIWESSNVPAWF